MISGRIHRDISQKQFFIRIEAIESNSFKLTVSDGRNIWESSRVHLADLIDKHQESIDEVTQISAVKLALFGEIPLNGLSKDDVVVELTENISGNLKISWKLKQMGSITIVLGAIILLKVDNEASRMIDLLSESADSHKIKKQLEESLELNKKLLKEMEMMVEEKLKCEDELYSKFRELYNKAIE